MFMRLKGKVALITGASSGMGKSAALLFASEGAKVIVNYAHSPEKADEVVSAIKRAGGEAVSIAADISKEDSIIVMVDSALKKFGKIDILYNNAGIELQKPVTATTEDEWNNVLDTNLKGMFLCCKHIIPIMVKNGSGSIINTASVAGLAGTSNLVAYSASKGGVIALTRALAIEHAPDKIRVNAICPGAIDTPMIRRFIEASPDPKAMEAQLATMHPLGRMGQPEDVAKLALFLASDESSFMTGAIIPIDGGYTAQ
jgi:NAD(P)-dependent dehydrogenase (short-subunit alcohol dehydrogenase family)